MLFCETASYHLYETGSKAASAIEGDSTLSAKYMAVSGNVSVDYSISKMFEDSYSWALFSYISRMIQVGISGWADYINEDGLKTRLKNLDPFDSGNSKLVEQYRSFFRTIGTHVITGANYGGRFQLVR